MAAEILMDRSGQLFGREADLQALQARLLYGLTAVVARPRMGKSWVLMELARRLAAADQPFLVGFANSVGEYADLFPRAVADLYQRWLGNANYLQQARQVRHQQKGKTLSVFAEAVGEQIDNFKGAVFAEPVATLLKGLFGGLSKANEDLKDGGLKLPRLQYESAREAVRAVYQLGGKRRVVLILDQWDNSPDIGYEATLLDQFLRDSDDWPPCHIVLAVRDEAGAALDAVSRLADDYSGTAAIHRLGLLDLHDEAERRRLLNFVRNNVPSLGAEGDTRVLDLIGGYPGVIHQWTRPYWHDHMKSAADAASAAAEAQQQLYSELKRLLAGLEKDERDLAIRIALLPILDDPEAWRALRPVVADGLDITLLDSLKRKRILESVDPPSYGHGTRREAAVERLLQEHRIATREQCRQLVLAISAQEPDADGQLHPVMVNALNALLPMARTLQLDAVPLALCRTASSIRNMPIDDPKELVAAVEASSGFTDRVGLAIIAHGLFNAFEDAREARHAGHMEEALGALRRFSALHAEDLEARGAQARALFNAYQDALLQDQPSRRAQFLAELRQFASAHHDEVVPCEALAKALVNELILLKGQADWGPRESLLGELRALTAGDSGVLHEQHAMGLYNAYVQARESKDAQRRGDFTDELRSLAASHPREPAVASKLAKALFFEFFDAAAARNAASRNAAMADLQQLAVVHARSPEVCLQYASALVNRLNDFDDPLPQPDYEARFNELGAIANRFPGDRVLRERMQMAVKGMLMRQQQSNASSQQNGGGPASH